MAKKKIERSGVIPYYIDDDGDIKMLMMKPANAAYGGTTYQVAKGKHDDGEDPLDAGMREAREEIGLFKGNVEHIHNLGVFLGRTHIFVAKIKDPDMFGDPSTPDEVAETKWLTPEQFKEEGRDLHKPIIKAAVRYIKKAEDID